MIFTPLKLVDPEVLQKPLQDHHWSIYSWNKAFDLITNDAPDI